MDNIYPDDFYTEQANRHWNPCSVTFELDEDPSGVGEQVEVLIFHVVNEFTQYVHSFTLLNKQVKFVWDNRLGKLQCKVRRTVPLELWKYYKGLKPMSKVKICTGKVLNMARYKGVSYAETIEDVHEFWYKEHVYCSGELVIVVPGTTPLNDDDEVTVPPNLFQ